VFPGKQWISRPLFPPGIMNKEKKTTTSLRQNRDGAALYMTMLILTGIFLAAMGMADIIITGIKMGGVQARSTQAYFASEAGVEKILWEYRKNGYSEPASSTEDIFGETLSNGSSYQLNYVREEDPDWIYKKFISVGEYNNVRRSVQAMLKYPKFD